MREQKIIERIVDLTAKALSEEHRDKFVHCLRERGPLLAQVVGKKEIEAEAGTLRSWLGYEQEVSARLEKEKECVLGRMDAVSLRKRAMHGYSPTCPFSSAPVFFDKSG